MFSFDPFEPEHARLNHEETAHHRLMSAVLQRAILDLMADWNHTGIRPDERQGAYIWFFDDNPPMRPPLTFSFVCEALGLDIEAVRASVRANFDEHLTKRETKILEVA